MLTNVILSALLTAIAAAGIALSMVIQRYALSHTSRPGIDWMPLLCVRLPRELVWFIGLVIYGAANGLQAFNQRDY